MLYILLWALYALGPLVKQPSVNVDKKFLVFHVIFYLDAHFLGRIGEKLLSNHSIIERPFLYENKSVNISLTFTLHQLIDIVGTRNN